MNAGERTIAWLEKHQLQVDAEWSVRTERGFQWWPYQHAQTVEIMGEGKGPDGAAGSYVAVRTETLRDLDLTDRLAEAVNELARDGANTMSGLVYDADTRRLDLCSLVLVHDDTQEWMQKVISIAATLQIGEAPALATTLIQHYKVEGTDAISGHPVSGMRGTPDEIAMIGGTLVIPSGKGPCAWTDQEFRETVDQYMQRPPALLATSGGNGFTVEFPYGPDASSLCQAVGDQPHVALGRGLRVTQSFPVSKPSDAEGARFVLLMNATELASKPLGYGFGSYFYREGLLCFSTFYPNFIHRPGLLRNLYFAAAQRARALSAILEHTDWDEQSFDIRHSAAGGAFFGPPPAVQPEKT